MNQFYSQTVVSDKVATWKNQKTFLVRLLGYYLKILMHINALLGLQILCTYIENYLQIKAQFLNLRDNRIICT